MAAHEIRNGAIAVRETGSGEPVVLLHGSASTGAQWRGLQQELKGDFRLVAVDLPGYGGTRAKALYGRPGLDRMAEALRGTIEACGRAVHLVGHSYGGAVALRIAMRRPELVSSLTLVEPALFHVLRDGDAGDRRLFAEIASVAGLIAAGIANDAAAAGMAGFIDFWNGDGSWTGTGSDLRARLTGTAGQVMADFRTLFAESWALRECAGIACPTLILKGARSVAVTRRIADMLDGTISGATLITVLEAGHMMPVTHPERVNPLIEVHLRATRAAAAAERRTAGAGDRLGTAA